MILQRLLAARWADELFELIHTQRKQITHLQQETERRDLEHARNVRDLLTAFREVMEDADLPYQLREALDRAISDMADEVARRTEHTL